MTRATDDRMILAIGDFEAGRIAPEDVKGVLIDRATREQPQFERVTALVRSGHFAYNGSDIPELTEKGRKSYDVLDRRRDPAQRPAPIAPASLPPLTFRDGKPLFFESANRQAETTPPTEQAPDNRQTHAAAALLREAETAVTQMQEKGIGFNEAKLSRAVFEAYRAGLNPPDPSRSADAERQKDAAATLLREAETAVTQMQERGIGFNEAKLSRSVFDARQAGIASSDRGQTRDAATHDRPTALATTAPHLTSEAASQPVTPLRDSALADADHPFAPGPPDDRPTARYAAPDGWDWHSDVFALVTLEDGGVALPQEARTIPADVARNHFPDPIDAIDAFDEHGDRWYRYENEVYQRVREAAVAVPVDADLSFNRDHATATNDSLRFRAQMAEKQGEPGRNTALPSATGSPGNRETAPVQTLSTRQHATIALLREAERALKRAHGTGDYPHALDYAVRYAQSAGVGTNTGKTEDRIKGAVPPAPEQALPTSPDRDVETTKSRRFSAFSNSRNSMDRDRRTQKDDRGPSQPIQNAKAALGPDDNDYTTPAFEQWAGRYEAELDIQSSDSTLSTQQRAATALLREAEAVLKGFRGQHGFPSGLEQAIRDAQTAGIGQETGRTNERDAAGERTRTFSVFRDMANSKGRDRTE